MREKVAIINSVFDYGSTGSLARQLYEYGKTIGYDMYAFYGRGKKLNDTHIVKIDHDAEVYAHKALALLTGLQGYFSNIATTKMLSYMEKIGITKVILLNLHGYYLNEKRLFDYFRKHNISIIYVMPDEYAGLGKCAYCGKCKNYLTGCGKCPKIKEYPKSLFFDQSKRIFNLKQQEYKKQKMILTGPKANIDNLNGSPLLDGITIKELDWGIDLDIYKYRENTSLYDKYSIPRDKILVLTVAKYSMIRKGVSTVFFGAAKALENSNIHFINVGYDGNLSDEKMPKNMTVIPYINDQTELAELYSLCDLYVLASKSDTQPLSALIALACETPVACFYASGLKYISNGDSDIVRYAKKLDTDAMIEVIGSTSRKNNEVRIKCRRLAEERYGKDIFNKKVFDLVRGRL